MRMCGDIFAAARLWRGRLLTTGHLSSRHPVVVGAGHVGGAAANACIFDDPDDENETKELGLGNQVVILVHM